MTPKITSFFKLHEPKIALFIGFVLVAVLSFEFGLIQGKKSQESPLIIEKPAASQNITTQDPSANGPEAQKTAQETKAVLESANTPASACAFVGSKNSNKYHVPTCHFAKLIKPENLICFADTLAATTKGYQPDKGCVK